MTTDEESKRGAGPPAPPDEGKTRMHDAHTALLLLLLRVRVCEKHVHENRLHASSI